MVIKVKGREMFRMVNMVMVMVMMKSDDKDGGERREYTWRCRKMEMEIVVQTVLERVRNGGGDKERKINQKITK